MFLDARQLAPQSRHGSSPMLVIGILLTIIILVVGVSIFYMGDSIDAASPIDYTAERGEFTHDVVEKGEVESSDNVELKCEVKGRNSLGTSILEVAPEGAIVEKGDLLVKLDSSALEDQLVQQKIVTSNKNALMIQSQNLYEAVDLSRNEYIQGTYEQLKQEIFGEIYLAKKHLEQALEYARYSDRLAAKGFATETQLKSDRLDVEKYEIELKAAQTKLNVLETYTKKKVINQLDVDEKITKAKWDADKRTYELEVRKLADIQDQIAKCEIFAPSDGQVIHANRRSYRGSNEFIVEAGAMVRERQTIIRLPNVKQMQIVTKINESQISLIRPGMDVTIVIDALKGKSLKGEVTQVNEYPEPPPYGSDIKRYLTKIVINDPPDSIRSGLTAKVNIHINRIDNVLQVPFQAIYQHGPDFYCFVRKGASWNPQRVKLGSTNDKHVVVEEGLAENDKVSLNPGKYLEMVSLPELSKTEPKEQMSGNSPDKRERQLGGTGE